MISSWGPFPIQPIVVRRELGDGWSTRIAQALLELNETKLSGNRSVDYGLQALVPIDDAAYGEERHALRALGQIPSDTLLTKTS